MMWKQAMTDVAEKTLTNIKRFNGRFPHVSEDGEHYELNNNNEWTNGFWSGILWLCYEYTNDPAFRQAAASTVRSFQQRMEQNLELDHHDIGFLYSLSSKAQWIIERDERAKQLTIEAADVLMKRWREKIELFQAWGPEGDLSNGGRIIVDCLMNLPLLFWASEVTGNPDYREAAIIHADKTRRFIVRGDDSTYHTFYFNQETGEALRGGTHQGYEDGSTWSRGQAWAIYGFAIAYRYTGNERYLETAKRTAKYFIENLPADYVAYWDFNAPITPDTKRDSSASAIASCGILELLSHLQETDPYKAFFQQSVQKQMTSLVENYASEKDAQGLIKRGSYSVRIGHAPDDYVIWGDYFYTEALMRLEKLRNGYWYEGK